MNSDPVVLCLSCSNDKSPREESRSVCSLQDRPIFDLAVQQKSFGRTPVDQTTGVMVNKDVQSPRGTTRFSPKASSIKQFYSTAEYPSTFLVQGNNTEPHNVELECPRIQKDEKGLSAVVGLIQGWINPFGKK